MLTCLFAIALSARADYFPPEFPPNHAPRIRTLVNAYRAGHRPKIAPVFIPQLLVINDLVFLGAAVGLVIGLEAHPERLSPRSKAEALDAIARLMLTAIDDRAWPHLAKGSGKYKRVADYTERDRRDFELGRLLSLGHLSAHNPSSAPALIAKIAAGKFLPELAPAAAGYAREITGRLTEVLRENRALRPEMMMHLVNVLEVVDPIRYGDHLLNLSRLRADHPAGQHARDRLLDAVGRDSDELYKFCAKMLARRSAK